MRTHLTGHTVRVLIGSEPKNHPAREVPEGKVSLEGFVGDRHAGLTRTSDVRTPWCPKGALVRNTRQVSLVSTEELALIAAALEVPRVEAAWLGANLELAGVPRLTHLPPGTRLFFPEEVILTMEGENTPCRKAGRALQPWYPDREGLASRFVKAAHQRRGLVGWVDRPGVIRPGDPVRILLPPAVTYSLP
ncbi:MOSC domain-containing protein [Stigmatella sp. ncwal1]|uniref:MOSC domain-containing protein n=1 Tax=Stigmatella ashevillensis TaxID=2995309 RepID=A0ABT5D8A9_9BACT|nr:MOSC domain-containing protein [Stigmatella ashevillena]MDC0709904.1 MOSC domain-containing protein [Stigmatella ashevillena]